MDALPWSRSGPLSADRLRVLDGFVREVQSRFTAQFFSHRLQEPETGWEFPLPARAIPRDTLTVETMLQLILAFFFDAAVVPTVLPFAIAQVPSLARLSASQARLTCFLVASVATRPVVTLHELEAEICIAEGVTQFVELGFGRQVHALPVAQQYFKLPPTQQHVPVTTLDFLAFVCRDTEARERLLQCDGDARDAVNAFAEWYTATATTHKRPPLHNNRQLGIHIQSLPALQVMLRQHTSQALTAARSIVAQAQTRLDTNTRLYTRLVEAVDRSLAEHALGNTHASHSPSVLTCRVHMSEAEAADTTVPRSLWEQAPREAAQGGLCLTLRTATTPPPSCHTGACEGSAVEACASSTIAPAAVSPPPLRRRGRVVVSSAGGPSTSLEAPGGAAPVSTASFGCVPLGLAAAVPVVATTPPPTAACGSTPSTAAHRTTTDSTACTPSSAATLAACLSEVSDERFATKAFDALAAVCIGDRLDRTVLASVWRRLAQLAAPHATTSWMEALLSASRDSAFIPLPTVHTATTAPSTVYVVGDVASPSEVYWPSSDGRVDESVPTDVSAWLSRSLDGVCGLSKAEEACVRDWFCTRLGVSATPSLRCWLAAALAHKREGGSTALRPLDAAFTSLTLRALDTCVRAELHAHLNADRLSSPPQDAAAALTRLLASVPDSEARESAVFPLHGLWRRGRADLFFSGPAYMQYTDVCALTPTSSPSATKAPPLLVLSFTSEPHFAVQAVLEHFGVRPLDAWLVKTVRLDAMAFVETALDIHRRLQLVLPHVQAYLSHVDPALYRLSRTIVARRLRSFRVVLGRGATLHASLPYYGQIEYTLQRAFPLLYVAQHNTLYGEDSACTPHVLSDTLCALFLPLTPESSVSDGLRHVLRQLLSVVTTATGDMLSETHLAALETRVAEEAAHTLGIAPRAPAEHVDADDDADVSWALSAAPFVRYQAHFPPGTDGTSSPAPFHRPVSVSMSDICASRRPDGQPVESVDTAATLLMTFSPHCAERQWARSLPQWQSPLFGDFYDGLQRFLRAARKDVQAGAVRVPRGHLFDTPAPSSSASRDAAEEDATSSGQFLGFGSHAPFPGAKRSRGDSAGLSAKQACSEGGRRQGGSVAAVYRGSDESAAAVASEAFVYDRLVEQYTAQDPSISVLWVNEQREQGTPYDMLVVRRRPGSRDSPNVIAFVEVKSTTQAHRTDFELSLRELLFAARYGTAYQIHRVFKASASRPDQMRVQVLSDLVSMWHKGKLSLTGEVRVMPAVQNTD